MKSLVKNSVYNILYVLLNIVFPLITSMYVSRVILVDGVGKVTYAQTITSYFLTIASIGIPIYGVKEIANCGGDKNKTSKLFSELFLINLISTIISSGAYFFMVFAIASFRNHIFLYLSCGVQLLLNAINIDWFFKGQEDFGYIVTRSFVVKIFSLFAIVCLVKQKEDYILYALISSLALAGNYIWNILYAKKHVELSFKEINLKKHFKPLLILSATVCLGNIYNKIDVTMLGGISGDYAVGLYSNAHKSVNLVLAATTAMTAVFLPRLSFLCNNNEKEELNKVLSLGANVLAFICIPACIGLYILSPNIVEFLYGEAFYQAYHALRIFVPLIIINSFGDLFCYQLIIATGNENKRFWANGLGAIFNIVLNALLIPIFMEKGAAVASVLSEVFINGFLFLYIMKMIKIELPLSGIMKSCLSAIIMGVLVMGVGTLPISNLLTCVCGIVVGIIVYLMSNVVLKNEVLVWLVKRVGKGY